MMASLHEILLQSAGDLASDFAEEANNDVPEMDLEYVEKLASTIEGFVQGNASPAQAREEAPEPKDRIRSLLLEKKAAIVAENSDTEVLRSSVMQKLAHLTPSREENPLNLEMDVHRGVKSGLEGKIAAIKEKTAAKTSPAAVKSILDLMKGVK